MKSFSWLKALSNRVNRHTARRPIRHASRLRLEVLEDRTVPSTSPALAAAYGTLPLAFEVNQGQADSQVHFLARGNGYSLSLTPGAAILDLQHGAAQDELQMQLVGSDPLAAVAGQDELATKTNYLIGSDPSQWHTNIANYGQVTYQNVYPGVNLVYYGNQGQLEYDFVLAPGASPGAIEMSIQGARGMALDAQGNLVLHTAGADVVEQAPVIYQNSGGVRQAVSGQFVIQGDNRIGFKLGAYDVSKPLTIDPVLSYSTYLGGNGSDYGAGIALDAAGNAYIVGTTYSANFPTPAGALQTSFGGNTDVFVAKLNAAGTGLVYSTYLGGDSGDSGGGIALDGAGNAYVTGSTNSANFPTTANAFQQSNPLGNSMAFITKLNATGSALLYSTYLGSTAAYDYDSEAKAIAVDGAGNAYVTGDTAASDFPTTQNAFQRANADDDPPYGTSGYSDAFVTKLNATGTGLVYSTYLGGSWDDYGYAIAVNSAGNAYVTGYTDAIFSYSPFPTTPGAFQTAASLQGAPFVTELNAGGTALVYSTFLGNGTTGSPNHGNGIAIDSTGNAYVTGTTQAPDFPTTPGSPQPSYGGLQDAFVTKLNATGSALVYSTYLGGSGFDGGSAIAIDGLGNAYVVGATQSSNFPTVNALQPVFGGGPAGWSGNDAFVATVNPAGTALVNSTYLGGSGDDRAFGVAVDAVGNAYVAGLTSSTNFPTTPGAVQGTNGGSYDAFVTKMNLAASPSFAVSGFPSPRTAGVAATFTVTVRNADGTPATNYTGTAHFSSGDAQAVLPADYTFTAADEGVHTFTATLKTAGTQSISVTDTTTSSFTGAESGITVNPAAASTLAVAGFPSATTAGVAHGFAVTARDPYGNTTPAYRGKAHFTSSDGQAVLPANYTFTAADTGVHNFSATLKTAGTQSITATDTVTSSITGTDAGITVNPAAASRFVITAPSSVSAGSAFSLTITVLDAYGNVATGYTGTIHFTCSDGTATLPANYTFTAADMGVHTFTGLVLRKKGTQKITVTDTHTSSLTASVNESVV